MNITETANIIAFSLLKGVGPAFIKKHLVSLRRGIEYPNDLSAIYDKFKLSDFEQNQEIAYSIISDCEKLNINVISIVDSEYPSSLLQIKDPPPVLYLKGNISLLNRAVAIIGTRKSTDLGNKIASRIGSFIGRNWSVCNGLVNGIDKHSIFSGNIILPNVIGVLSGGLNYEYTCNGTTKDMAQQVLSNNGLLISEYEPNRKEDQFSGSKASRIQAGLAKLLIIIQSSTNGGSKYTLKAFSVLERPLAVVNFKNNLEFSESVDFEANRLIVSKANQGIMEMCDIKRLDSILITKILRIESSEDYKLIENELAASDIKSNLDGV